MAVPYRDIQDSRHPPVHVVKATVAASSQLIETLVRAFACDPIYLWLVSGDRQRLYALFRAYLHRLALQNDETYMTDDGLGVALWAPPQGWRLGWTQQLLFLPDWLHVIGLKHLWSRWRGVEMIQQHHPDMPHWYLMAIGIDPQVQGQGRATQLLQPVLTGCDAQGLPAFLETAAPDTLPLYRRFGFEVIDTLQVPAGGPTLWLMWRAPQQIVP